MTGQRLRRSSGTTLCAVGAVENADKARDLEKYFKLGSGKAIAIKRFL